MSLPDLASYRAYLAAHTEEWAVLDSLCLIPISRFYRDRRVFDVLFRDYLPAIARAATTATVECWSAGCASGEEAYTILIGWKLLVGAEEPAPPLHMLGTDADPTLIERARDACYPPSALKDLPSDWLAVAFQQSPEGCLLRAEFRQGADFLCQNLREALPSQSFDVILCRNFVFTYFDSDMQRTMVDRLTSRLSERGLLVIGATETLPEGCAGVVALDQRLGIYARDGAVDCR